MRKLTSSPSGSMTEAVYLALHDEIVSCRLKPGSRIRIGDLCEALGANLSAVREALARLQSDGLVVAEPQKGFRVAPVSVKDLTDLAHVRLEIALLCIRAALANTSLEWELGVVAALHRIRKTPVHTPEDSNVLNQDFLKAAEQYFEALMSACENQRLLQVHRQLYTQYERYRRLTMIGFPNRDMYEEFNGLTEAALSGDLGLTELRLRTLIAPSERFLDSLMAKVEIASALGEESSISSSVSADASGKPRKRRARKNA